MYTITVSVWQTSFLCFNSIKPSSYFIKKKRKTFSKNVPVQIWDWQYLTSVQNQNGGITKLSERTSRPLAGGATPPPHSADCHIMDLSRNYWKWTNVFQPRKRQRTRYCPMSRNTQKTDGSVFSSPVLSSDRQTGRYITFMIAEQNVKFRGGFDSASKTKHINSTQKIPSVSISPWPKRCNKLYIKTWRTFTSNTATNSQISLYG